MKRKLLLAAVVTASLANSGLMAQADPAPTGGQEAGAPPAPTSEPTKTWRDRFSGGWDSFKGYGQDYSKRAAGGLFGYGVEADPFEDLPASATRWQKAKRKSDEFFGSKPAKMARITGASLIGGAGLGVAGADVWSSAKRRFSFVGYQFAKNIMRYSDEDAMAFAQKSSTKVIAPVLSIIMPYLLQAAIRPGKSYMRQSGEYVGGKMSDAVNYFRKSKTADANKS